MKKSELSLFLSLPFLDFLGILLAGIVSYFLRFKFFAFKDLPTFFLWNFKEYFIIISLTALFLLFIFALAGLYSFKEKKRKLWEEFFKILMAVSLGIMAIVIYIFFKRELFTSRFLILSVWSFSIIFVFLLRIILRFIQKLFYKAGIGVYRAVLIGNNPTTIVLKNEIKKNLSLGYQICLESSGSFERVFQELNNFLEKQKIDLVIQGEANFSKKEILKLIDFCEEKNIAFKFAPDFFEARVLHTQTEILSGIPLVEIKRTPLDGWGRIAKRIVDIVGSIFLIILFSPIMLLAAIAIKIDSRGPIFFSYKRVGKNGKPFVYFKFRSMIDKAHDLRYTKEFLEKNIREGPIIKFKDDPRITRVGNFIRKYSIDELAEFFLVLKGKISLVGPRPHEIEEVEKYQKHYRKVLTIKPGMTGLAQISGRSDLDFDDEVKLDLFYIENWSFWKDFYILFKTPIAVLKKRKAN